MLVFLLGLQYASNHTNKVMIDREIKSNTSIMVNEEYHPQAKRVDYRNQLSPWHIYQQGECGNCYAVAVTSSLQATAQLRQNLTQTISPGFVTANLTYSSKFYHFLGCNGGWIGGVPAVMGGHNKIFSACNDNEQFIKHPSYCGIGSASVDEFCCADDIKTRWTNDGLETCTNSVPDGCDNVGCTKKPVYEDCDIPKNYLSQGSLKFLKLNASFHAVDKDCVRGPSTDTKRNCPQLMTYLLHEFGPIATAVGAYPDAGSVVANGQNGWFDVNAFPEDADLTQYCHGYRGTSYENKINHAVTIVGDRTHNGRAQWIVQNSWGNNWGDNGYFYVDKGQNYCGIETEFGAWHEIHLEGNPEPFAPTLDLKFATAFADTWPQNERVWPAPAPTPSTKTSKTKWYHYAAMGVGGAIIVAIILWAFKPRKRKIITADDDSMTLTLASAGQPRKLRL